MNDTLIFMAGVVTGVLLILLVVWIAFQNIDIMK